MSASSGSWISSTGENAPMPPVLGPVSPSPMRLKSRAGASGSARSPVAQREHRQLVALEELLDQHGVVAEAPLLEHRHERRVRLRLVLGDHDALAGREPVGLDHRGVGGDRRHALLDRAHDPVPAGRHARPPPSSPSRTPSSPRAAPARAWARTPGRPEPPARRRGRPPAAPPGPTTTRSMPDSAAAVASATGSPGSASSSSVSARMPALPGTQTSSGRCGERASARTTACSRPPAPTTRTFMRPEASPTGRIDLRATR